MSTTESYAEETASAKPSDVLDSCHRKHAAHLMYAAALFFVISILIEGWLTSRWNLNLGFVIFWLCGHFLLTGSRGAVKWSLRLTILILVIAAIHLITTIVAPYRIELKNYAITPPILRMVIYLSIATTIWAIATLIPLIKVRRSEQLKPDAWFDLKTLTVIIVIPTLIFAIIFGLTYLDSPYVDLADEMPVINSQSEQVKILQSRYVKQLEYLKTLAADPNHNIFNRERRELEQNSLWNDSGIVKASYQALDDNGLTFSTNTLHHSSYRSSIGVTVPGFHNTGVVILDDDKRYSVLYYRDHFQDDNGVWLGIELIVRQDHLQERDIREQVNRPELE